MRKENLLDKRIVVNEQLVDWKLIDQEVVFLHNKEKVFYELNRTATYIWLKANGKKPIREIIKGLITKFLINKDKAKKDTIEFISGAIKNKIFLLV
ncbi:MAG: hypothetical protein AMJ95_02450 [Omnitrophica WOR_2 bacterium SM23_72]|nr:MAG: hypothetical protein AMJ95_02450 [Omnitrophica WOR_2 bacterium SM23_72]